MGQGGRTKGAMGKHYGGKEGRNNWEGGRVKKTWRKYKWERRKD
jgi:hypothetical protein